jgi:LEA14-like dessication related protein
MKKYIFPVLLGLGAYGLWYVYKLKAAADKLSIKLGSLKLDKSASTASGFTTIVLNANVVVTNPTSTNINISSIDLHFYINGITLAVINYNDPFIIKSNTSTVVMLPVNINTVNLLSSTIGKGIVKDLRAGKLDVGYTGYIKSGLFSTSVQDKIKLS